jgi:hypothetical protein
LPDGGRDFRKKLRLNDRDDITRQGHYLLVANNTTPERARRLSTLAIASIEGAVILCRSPQPLKDVFTELAPLFV